MKLLLVGLALAVLQAPGEPRNSDPAPIDLYTSFQQAPPPEVLEAIQGELSRIMNPAGMPVRWRPVTANEVSVDLAVVKFVGRCDGNRTPHPSAPIGALGWTHMSDGVILPFADIDCDAVRNLTESRLFAESPRDRDAALGRALARVLSHELYHILARTTHHDSCGVGKATYSAAELLAPEFRFERDEAKAMRSNRPPPQPPLDLQAPARSAGN
jgi:hypothetical protein